MSKDARQEQLESLLLDAVGARPKDSLPWIYSPDGGRPAMEACYERVGRFVLENYPDATPEERGGHIRLEFSDPVQVEAAALALGADVGTDLALQVPSDGSMDALRDVLDRLEGVKVERLSVHTPDLDDVFLALTGSGTP